MARYRFGVFEADEATGELTRSGRRLHLAPQPFRALLMFLARAGEVVTREELQKALWDQATFVEFEQGVNFTVSRLRAALGERARSPHFLETVPRRGYRFVGPVEWIEPKAVSSASLPEAPPVRSPFDPPASRGLGKATLVVRAAVVAALALATTSSMVPRHQTTAGARAAFQRGQDLADSGQRRKSLVAFREAVRLDPWFAEGHFAIAFVYVRLAETGELAAAEAFPIARAEAQHALALEEVADTHLVLGSERFFFAWDWAGARHEFERAVALEPASTATLSAYARLLSAIGEHAAALDVIARAEAVSPSCDLVVHEAAWAQYRARRYVEAVRKFERAATLGPPHFTDQVSWRKLNRFRILLVHLQMGSPVAGEDAREIARLAGATPEQLTALGSVSGEEAARRVLRKSVELLSRAAEREYVSPVRFAELHAALGQERDALTWLQRAADERAPALAYSVGDPVFDRLRTRSAFRDLVARMGRGDAAPPGRAPMMLVDGRVGRPPTIGSR